METFRQMVNHCIKIGLETNVSSRKALSQLAYRQLASCDILSYYKLCGISHAAGILANRKKSIKRGLRPREPYARKPLLVSCYGFKISKGVLRIPLGNKEYLDISLKRHVRNIISDSSLRVRSFTLTFNALSICYSKEVAEIQASDTNGIDRNLCNLTVGNMDHVIQYNISKAVDIAENTRSVMKSLTRNDVRIRRELYRKYGIRRKNRVNQLLHRVTKTIIHQAKANRSAIVLEDIRYLRRLYRKGNYQGRSFRGRMNGWSFSEVKRQIEYKAAWEGVPVIQLSVKETRGTSQLCPRCGKKITQVDRKSRQLWCAECKKWMDRDVAAAMNLSIKGRAFLSSHVKGAFERPEGLANETMKGKPESVMPAILRVDASKLVYRIRRKDDRTRIYNLARQF